MLPLPLFLRARCAFPPSIPVLALVSLGCPLPIYLELCFMRLALLNAAPGLRLLKLRPTCGSLPGRPAGLIVEVRALGSCSHIGYSSTHAFHSSG